MQYEEFMRIVGALLKVVVLSMVIERAFAFIFEHAWFDRLFNKSIPDPEDKTKTIRVSKIPGIKGLLALGSAIAICHKNSFDVLSAIFNRPASDQFGVIITSFVVAGGSAGAIAIFQGFLNLGKESRDALIEARKKEAEAARELAELQVAQAKANQEKAELEKAEAELRKTLVQTEVHRMQAEALAADVTNR